MAKFGCCQSTEVDSSGYIVCKACKIYFHCQCILSDNKKKSLTKEFKASWLCPSCQSKTRRPKTDSTPIRSSNLREIKDSNDKSPPPSSSIPSIEIDSGKSTSPSSTAYGKMDLADIIKTEVNKMKDELCCTFKKIFSTEISSLRQELLEIKSSMEFISKEYDSLKTKMDKIEAKSRRFDGVVGVMEDMKKEFNQLVKDNNVREQWARRSNIEILGVPEKKGENLLNIINNLAEKSKFDLMPTDIDFVTRVAPSVTHTGDRSKPKPIVVRLLSRYRKDDFLVGLRKLGKLKSTDIGFSGRELPIYFNDHLTKCNKSLLQQVKNLSKDKNYKYVWVKNCTIMARMSDISPVLHIASEDDLKKIV